MATIMPPYLEHPTYTYRAEVVKIVDADTIDVKLDLGFRMSVIKRLRLMDIDAWETRGFERGIGLLAKEYVVGRLHQADKVFVQTIMDAEGKYGRLLAWVWVTKNGETYCLNKELVDKGHALFKQY